MIRFADEMTLLGKIERCISFTVFAVAVSKFAHKMGMITSLRPSLAEIQTN